MTNHLTKRSRHAWTPEDIVQLAKHKVPKGHTYSSARARHIKRVGTDFHCLIETPCPEAVARYVNSLLQL